MNDYRGYIWDFYDYLTEWYRRDKIQELWQVYMAKCVSAGIDKNLLPDYATLLKQIKSGKVAEESPEQIVERLIKKIDEANGGDK